MFDNSGMANSLPERGSKNWKRLDGIDCLRALAIFYVLMNHVNMQLFFARVPYTRGLPEQLVNALVWQGQRGVQIFFAVSGFLITSTTIQRWGSVDKVSLRGFYLVRIARIAPLLLLLLAALSALHLLAIPHFIVSKSVGGLRNALFAALTFHVGLLEATRGYLPGNWDILWSLSVEEVFYLGFPIACRLFGRGRLRGMGLVVLLLIFVALGPFARTVFTHGNGTWKEYSYLGGMDAIALGCLTALAVSKRRVSIRTARWLALSGLVLLAAFLAFGTYPSIFRLEKLGLDMTFVAIGACLLMIAASETRWQVWRGLHPLLAYGQRSYEVYLTHMFIVFACFDLFVRLGKPLRLVPLLFITVILMAGILGDTVARLYSEPMNRRLRAYFAPSSYSNDAPTLTTRLL